jgi:hypothetical protein
VLSSTLKALQSIGEELISQRKAELLATTEGNPKGGVEKKTIQGRDLLSLLIKANMATDLPDSSRMTDEEILSRESELEYCYLTRNVDAPPFFTKEVPTFLLAGHETTRLFRSVVQPEHLLILSLALLLFGLSTLSHVTRLPAPN